MKNITLKIDDKTYDQARLSAARKKTSISGLVREYLVGLGSEEDHREAERLAALVQLFAMADARDRSTPGSAGPFSRAETYADRLR